MDDNNMLRTGTEATSEKSQEEIRKLRKYLKTLGDTLHSFGWLGIIILSLFFIGFKIIKIYFNETPAGATFPFGTLTFIFPFIVIGIVLVVLGDRIRKGVDKNIIIYLYIFFGWYLFNFVLSLIAGSRMGLAPFFVLILGALIIKFHKALKIKEFSDSLITPKYILNWKGWIVFAIAAVALFFAIAFVETHLLGVGINP